MADDVPEIVIDVPDIAGDLPDVVIDVPDIAIDLSDIDADLADISVRMPEVGNRTAVLASRFREPGDDKSEAPSDRLHRRIHIADLARPVNKSGRQQTRPPAPGASHSIRAPSEPLLPAYVLTAPPHTFFPVSGFRFPKSCVFSVAKPPRLIPAPPSTNLRR